MNDSEALDKLNRRRFGVGLAALVAGGQAVAAAQTVPAQTTAAAGNGLKTLTSGVFHPAPASTATQAKRVSHKYTSGMLRAGNIQLEMHETIQELGAEHEPVGTHLHNEIWCVQRGVASLFINDVEHRMEAGDTGLVCAGDRHWIKNIGDTELAYFVITVGPPEPGRG